MSELSVKTSPEHSPSRAASRAGKELGSGIRSCMEGSLSWSGRAWATVSGRRVVGW